MSEESFTSNMEINMPQNPKNPLSEHPSAIKGELRKEQRTRSNKKKSDDKE